MNAEFGGGVVWVAQVVEMNTEGVGEKRRGEEKTFLWVDVTFLISVSGRNE